MTRDRDPERSERVADRLDGRHYGDRVDEPSELHGEAPLCDGCGERQAVERVDELDLCGDCADEVEALRGLAESWRQAARGDEDGGDR